jgi:hypothetical protein
MEFEKAVAAEISRIRKRLAELAQDVGGVPKRKIARTRVGRTKARRMRAHSKSKRKLSPKVRAQRVLQGQYMGHVRRLTVEQKKTVSATREKFGYRKAIAEAKRIAAKTKSPRSK